MARTVSLSSSTRSILLLVFIELCSQTYVQFLRQMIRCTNYALFQKQAVCKSPYLIQCPRTCGSFHDTMTRVTERRRQAAPIQLFVGPPKDRCHAQVPLPLPMHPPISSGR